METSIIQEDAHEMQPVTQHSHRTPTSSSVNGTIIDRLSPFEPGDGETGGL
jgi:hypothetical protein